MRSHKRPATLRSSIIIELAAHTAMGMALGLGFSLGLIVFDAFKIGTLIAHSIDPQSSAIVFAGTLTLAFAVGATMTGFVLTMVERQGSAGDQ